MPHNGETFKLYYSEYESMMGRSIRKRLVLHKA